MPTPYTYAADLPAFRAALKAAFAAGQYADPTTTATDRAGTSYQPAAYLMDGGNVVAILQLNAMAEGTHHTSKARAYDAAAELIREAQNCGEAAEIETARQHFIEAVFQNTNDDTAEDASTVNSFSRIACTYLASAAAQHPEAAPLGYLPIHTIDGPAYALTDMLGGMAYQPGPECMMTEARAAAMRRHLLKIAQDRAARNFEDGFTLHEWRPATAVLAQRLKPKTRG